MPQNKLAMPRIMRLISMIRKTVFRIMRVSSPK